MSDAPALRSAGSHELLAHRDFADRKLPHRLQTFATLYGTWFEHLSPSELERAAPLRLQTDDVVGLIGTHAAIDAAKLALLDDGGSQPEIDRKLRELE